MSGLRKAELERVKQDLTSVKDRVRLAYARHVSRIERQFMFVGTSNRRDFYLTTHQEIRGFCQSTAR